MKRKSVELVLCMVLLAAFVFVTGCARDQTTVSPRFPDTEEVAAVPATVPEYETPDGRLGEGVGEGFDEGDLPIEQTELARDLVFQEAKQELKTIYFDYDSSALKPAAKAKLETAALWLKRNAQVNLQIEGHCDERGTNEYNLALGERRALAARRYLVSLGISSDRIFTISYGEERPASEGHAESVWKFNRRDDFNISF